MKKTGMQLGCLICFFLALMMGCSADKAENRGTDKKADAQLKLTFGYQTTTHQIAYLMAKNKGWWDALTPMGAAEIREKTFTTGAPEMQAMLTGEIDIAYVGAAPLVTAISQGLDAKIIAAVQIQGSNLVLRPEFEYTRPHDLKGFTLATFPPGTIQDTLLRGWLLENGLDPDKDVDIRGMGAGDAISAIFAKNVEAVFLPHPAPAIIEFDGNGRSIVASGQMKTNHACCVLAVTGALIREHPEMIKKIVDIHIRATQYIQNHQDEAARIFSDRTSLAVEKVKKSFKDWDGRWLADPYVIIDSVVEYAVTQKALGYIDRHLSEKDIFSTGFYDLAVR